MANSLLAMEFGVNERGIILFGFEIYFYAICIVSGMLLAAFLSALLMKRRNMSSDFIFLLFIVCIPTAIFGARLFACLSDKNIGIERFFDFRDGGLSIIGGVIGGILAGLVVCLVKKVDFLRAADCVVPNILIAQSLGRWGNFFNAEVYGGVVSNSSMQWFPFAVPISDLHGVYGIGSFADPQATWHYAFFFYESVINLIGWAILFSIAWRFKKKPNGLFLCGYCAWYGLVRTIMEPLRDSEFIYENMTSQIFSAALLGLGICGCLVLFIVNFRKEKAFIGSRTGDPCGITKYLTPYKDDMPYFSEINLMGSNYPPKPEDKKAKSKDKSSAKQEHSSETSEHSDGGE